MSAHTKAVYDTLRDGKKHTEAKLREASGLNDADFDSEMQRLERDYWVERTGDDGKASFKLTDKGVTHLSQLHPD